MSEFISIVSSSLLSPLMLWVMHASKIAVYWILGTKLQENPSTTLTSLAVNTLAVHKKQVSVSIGDVCHFLLQIQVTCLLICLPYITISISERKSYWKPLAVGYIRPSLMNRPKTVRRLGYNKAGQQVHLIKEIPGLIYSPDNLLRISLTQYCLQPKNLLILKYEYY